MLEKTQREDVEGVGRRSLCARAKYGFTGRLPTPQSP